MKAELVYVELKTGYNDNGPAWIGVPAFSKSKSTIYFNGLALKSLKGSGVGANYFEFQSGDEYWVSGVKVSGQDRHWAGGGRILIDNIAVKRYLTIIGLETLPKNIVPTELKISKPSVEQYNYENESLSEKAEPVLGRRPITKTVNRLKK